ncbi:MAG: hypothetical protein E7043_03675 [Lentisphaerae bacterium]|nr:hypothetical protein [Lentisphaerota bacterium]
MAINKETSKNFWWTLFIVLAMIMSAVFLYPLYKTKNEKLEELEKRKELLLRKEIERENIEKRVNALENSPEAVESEARNKFGMGRKQEKILRYEK